MFLTNKTTTKLSKISQDKDYLLLGEMHGVKENALLVEELVDKITSIKTVGFEYPNEIESALNQASPFKKELLDYPPVQTMLKDGRFSQTHMDVISRLVKKGIKIICFDPKISSTDWNERDKGMAKIVMSYRKKLNKNTKILLICGNMHSRIDEFDLDSSTEKGKNYHYRPFGSYLKNQINIKFNYLSGQFYNFGLKKFPTDPEPHKNQLQKNNKQWLLNIKIANPTRIDNYKKRPRH